MTPAGGRANRVIGFDALTPDEHTAWLELRGANPLLDSPYFHPGFAAAVHASGHPVQVRIVYAGDGSVEAFLPFHREGARMRPVGWPGADFQGPIMRAQTVVEPLSLLGPGLKTFEFDHLLEPGPAFDRWITARHISPFLDVSGGLDGYTARSEKTARDQMSAARRKLAKLERENGPVRVEIDDRSGDVLDRVIEFKRGQYAATGARDYFATPGRVGLLHRLLSETGPDFGGLLTSIHVGDQFLAGHFGLRSDGILHWWFPTYDPEFGRYSPGWILLRELVAAAPELGVHRIDLGRGDDEYKRRAKTGEQSVCAGMISSSQLRLTTRLVRDRSIAAVKASPLGPKVRAARNRLRSATTGSD